MNSKIEQNMCEINTAFVVFSVDLIVNLLKFSLQNPNF